MKYLLMLGFTFAIAQTGIISHPEFDPFTTDVQPVLFLASSSDVEWTTSDGQTATGITFLFEAPGSGRFRIKATLNGVTEDRFVYVQSTDPSRAISWPRIQGFSRSLTTVNPGQETIIRPVISDQDSFGPWAVHWFYLKDGQPRRLTADELRFRSTQESPEGIPIYAVVADNDGNFSPHSSTEVFVLEGNLPPTSRVIEPKYIQGFATVGEPIRFFADAIDPEGDVVSYTWREIQSGDEYSGNPVDVTFDSEGLRVFQLRAVDSGGHIDPSFPQFNVNVYAQEQVPTTIISLPLQNQRLDVGDSVVLGGQSFHPSGANLDVAWRILRNDQLLETRAGQGPHRVFVNQTGIYQIQLDAVGFPATRSSSNTRFLAVHEPKTNKPPEFTHTNIGTTLLVANQSTQTLSLSANDPEGDEITYEWFSEGVRLAGTTSTQTINFDFPEDAFQGGLARLNFAAFARDSSGNYTKTPGGIFVTVYEDRMPPSANISGFDSLSTIRIERGSLFNLFTELENAEGLDLNFFWSITRDRDSFFFSDQREPGQIRFDEAGVYFVSLFLNTSDFSLATAFVPSIWLHVYEPDQTPDTLITRPLESALFIESGTTVQFDGVVREPAFVDSDSPISTFDQVINRLSWVIDGPSGQVVIESDELVNYCFDQEGSYTVKLETINSLGLVDANPDSLTITVLGVRSDSSLEPNDTREQAATIVAGNYSQLSLDDNDPVDWYRFFLTETGATIELTFDLLASATDGKVEVYAGDTLLQVSPLRAGRLNPFIFNGSHAGQYDMKVSLNDANKGPGSLNFGVGITTANPRLIFPYPKYDVVDTTSLTVVNPFSEPAVVVFEARNKVGQTLSEVTVTLEPFARTERSIEQLFPQLNVLDLDWVRVRSNRSVIGMGLTLARDQKTAIAEPAIIGNLNELVIPHIAQNTEQWYTKAAVINNSSVSASALFNSVAGDWSVNSITDPYAHDLFDFVQFLGGSLPAGTEWGRFLESAANPAMAGMEIFGKRDGNLQVAGLNLTSDKLKNPNFFYIKKNIIFPHVAADTVNFWTGIAFVNTENSPVSATLRAYDASGNVLAEEPIIIEGTGKRVGLAYQLFPTLNENTAISWVHLETDGSITGYELFGSNDGTNRRLAGLQAVTGGGTSLVFPKIWVESGIYWTGLAAVNLSQSENAVLTYTAYADDGSVRGSVERTIGPLQKDVALAESLFDGVLPYGTTWIKVNATQPIAAFELVGDIQGEFLAGLIAQ